MTGTKHDRDALIVERYAAGATLAHIGAEHSISRERVRQILVQQGAVTAEDARRVRREGRAAELSADVDRFLVEYRDVLEEMAVAGIPRTDVEARFSLLLPEIPQVVVRESADQAGLLFNVDVQEFIFTEAVIECAVWFALARDAGLAPAPWATVIPALDLAGARQVGNALQREGLDAAVVAHILRMAYTAKRYAAGNSDVGLSAKRYNAQRAEILTELGLQSRQGNAPWPPTSQTVMKRLGDGSWADAQRRLSLSPDRRGRKRGLILYDEDQYTRALRGFLDSAQATDRTATFQDYGRWVDDEERAGRHWPSAESVRLRYRNWTAAKRLANISGGPSRRRRVSRGAGASVAALALHIAKTELEQFWRRLEQVPGSEQRTMIDSFLCNYAQEFEFRRRDWLRAVVASDDTAVARQLARPDLSAKARGLLSAAPPNVAAVLTDR